MTMGIDLDKLDAAVAAAPGDAVRVTKAQWEQISADLRRGYAAQRAVASVCPAAIAAMDVAA